MYPPKYFDRCRGCLYNYRTVINPISGGIRSVQLGCWAPFQWAFKYFPDCFIPEAKTDIIGCAQKKIAIIILEVKDKRDNYVPCIVKENEVGYFLTNWQWGKDKEMAQRMADEYNEMLGVSKNEAIELTLKSMRPAHEKSRSAVIV